MRVAHDRNWAPEVRNVTGRVSSAKSDGPRFRQTYSLSRADRSEAHVTRAVTWWVSLWCVAWGQEEM